MPTCRGRAVIKKAYRIIPRRSQNFREASGTNHPTLYLVRYQTKVFRGLEAGPIRSNRNEIARAFRTRHCSRRRG